MKVREWMDQAITGISPRMKVGDALAFLLRHALNGTPVVDDDGKLLGMLTFSDIGKGILPTQEEIHADPDLMKDPRLLEDRFVDVARKTVEEIMSRNPKSISPDQSIMRVAALMRANKVKQIPVVENGKVVGQMDTNDFAWGFLTKYRKYA